MKTEGRADVDMDMDASEYKEDYEYDAESLAPSEGAATDYSFANRFRSSAASAARSNRRRSENVGVPRMESTDSFYTQDHSQYADTIDEDSNSDSEDGSIPLGKVCTSVCGSRERGSGGRRDRQTKRGRGRGAEVVCRRTRFVRRCEPRRDKAEGMRHSGIDRPPVLAAAASAPTGYSLAPPELSAPPVAPRCWYVLA